MSGKVISIPNDLELEALEKLKASENDVLTIIATNFDFWKADQGVFVTDKETQRHYPLYGSELKSVIKNRFLSQHQKVISSSRIDECLPIIEHTVNATFRHYHVGHRFFMDEDHNWYVDASMYGKRTYIKVNPLGIEEVESVPCRFIPLSLDQPFEVDLEDTLTWTDIETTLGISIEPEKSLLFSYIMGCMRPNINYPLLYIQGDQGSGKTTLAKMIKQMIDPQTVNVISFPEHHNDLMSQVSSNYLAVYDNLYTLTKRQQDDLCKISTGMSHIKRKLFSDNDAYAANIKSPIILTSIYDVVTAPDLRERTLHFNKGKLSTYQSESKMERAFQKRLPKMRGFLLQEVQRILKNIEQKEFIAMTRMVDFEEWAQATSHKESKGFSTQWEEQSREAALTMIYEEPVLKYLYDVVEERGSYSTTVPDLRLLTDLDLAKETDKAISQKITLSSPLFKKVGIQLDYSQKDSKTRRKVLYMEKKW